MSDSFGSGNREPQCRPFFKRELRRWDGINGTVTRRHYLTGFIAAHQHHTQAGVILYGPVYLRTHCRLTIRDKCCKIECVFLGIFYWFRRETFPSTDEQTNKLYQHVGLVFMRKARSGNNFIVAFIGIFAPDPPLGNSVRDTLQGFILLY